MTGLCASADTALPHLQRAVTMLEGSPRRLDAARALVELGAALRRSNRRVEAREPLSRGMDLAESCAARALADRAKDELRAAGGRPRRQRMTGLDALTVTEARIARMAATGMSNAQIAQAQFVTRKTVETHLGRIYRKLGIGARDDLAATLDATNSSR